MAPAGPSARHELFYFGGPELGAVRVDNKYQFYTQPDGWPGPKVTTDMPLIYNIRQDPFERTPILNFSEGAFWPLESNQGTTSRSTRALLKPPPRGRCTKPFMRIPIGRRSVSMSSAGVNAGYGPRKRSPAASRRR
jgi:hypothetical protein